MLKNILRRNLRQPLASLAVLLLASVITVVFCHLHSSRQEELRSYEATYSNVPVFFKVVDLDGSKPKDYTGINGWVTDLFESGRLTPSFLPFAKETHVRISLEGRYYLTDESGCPVLDKWGEQKYKKQTTTGISSTRVAQELTEGWGGKVYWTEGCDGSILLGNEFVCIVPESMRDTQVLDMEFINYYWPTGVVGDLAGPVIKRQRDTFRVVGYYTDPGNTRIYCPYYTLEGIHTRLNKAKVIEEIGAILNDNTQLPQLKEVVDYWFVKPNPMGEKTPWGLYGFEYYPYAMDVDDTMLYNLEAGIKNSLRLNQLSGAMVFVISLGTGFLSGFLVIRSRKREIVLMRTVGASQPGIFWELALEQMLCVALGIVLGGSYTHWQPWQKLALFGGVYFVGLGVALIVFMRKNLLTTIKEDE